MDYFISDSHFNHENIIRFCDRPFDSSEQMTQVMIERWNSVIHAHDRVFHLGDFSFNLDLTELKDLVSHLKGHKYLILGNHDSYKPHQYRAAGFKECFKYPIIYENFYILSHTPVFLNDRMPYINIHGHIHNARYDESNYINVCVEQTDYYPISFPRILSLRGGS